VHREAQPRRLTVGARVGGFVAVVGVAVGVGVARAPGRAWPGAASLPSHLSSVSFCHATEKSANHLDWSAMYESTSALDPAVCRCTEPSHARLSACVWRDIAQAKVATGFRFGCVPPEQTHRPTSVCRRQGLWVQRYDSPHTSCHRQLGTCLRRCLGRGRRFRRQGTCASNRVCTRCHRARGGSRILRWPRPQREFGRGLERICGAGDKTITCRC